MKRVLPIAIALLLGFWLLLGPAGVGVYLRGWAPAWVEQWTPDADTRFQSGWFASALTTTWPDDTRLEIRGRHLPPARLAWLGMEGTLHWPPSPEPVAIRGRLGLLGALELSADAGRIRSPETSRVQTDARDAGLSLRQTPDGAVDLGALAMRLDVEDHRENRLALGRAMISLRWQPDRTRGGRLELAARAERNGRPGSHVSITAEQVDPEALGQLVDALSAYRNPPADDFSRRMLDLAAATAWQSLVHNGLVLSRMELDLDDEASFNGTWNPETGPPEIVGNGRIGAILDWAGPLIGLSRDIPPREAEREARAWISALVDHGWMVPENGDYRFRYPPELPAAPSVE